MNCFGGLRWSSERMVEEKITFFNWCGVEHVRKNSITVVILLHPIGTWQFCEIFWETPWESPSRCNLFFVEKHVFVQPSTLGDGFFQVTVLLMARNKSSQPARETPRFTNFRNVFNRSPKTKNCPGIQRLVPHFGSLKLKNGKKSSILGEKNDFCAMVFRKKLLGEFSLVKSQPRELRFGIFTRKIWGEDVHPIWHSHIFSNGLVKNHRTCCGFFVFKVILWLFRRHAFIFFGGGGDTRIYGYRTISFFG